MTENSQVAFRQIQEVKSRAITIQLPADFSAKKVEVIVRSLDDSALFTVNQLQNLLMTAPTISNTELKNFEDIRNWMSQWIAQEF